MKRSLNSDGQQFHQYQHNEQSPLIFPQTTTYDDGNPGSGLGQAQTCGGVKPLNGTPTLLLGLF